MLKTETGLGVGPFLDSFKDLYPDLLFAYPEYGYFIKHIKREF